VTKKNLYMHIGTPKTGTTAIQYFLRENNNLLKKKNFLVYTAQDDNVWLNLRFMTAYLDIFGKLELMIRGYLPKKHSKQKKTLNNWYKKFHADIKQSTCENILLSEEMLWWAVCGKEKMLELLNDLRDDFKIKIIVYLRRQDYYIMSMYQQALKAGRCQGMKCSEWIESPDNPQKSSYSYYDEHLKWLVDTVGKENMIIRIYEKEQLESQSIFSDFMSTIGLELSDEFVIPEKNINEGLSPFAAEMARNFSSGNTEKANFMRFILNYNSGEFFNKLGQQHDFMSPADRCKLLSEFENGNKYIARELLGREDGRLFYEQPPDSKQDWTPYEPSLGDTVSFLLKVLDKQGQEIENLQKTTSFHKRIFQKMKFVYYKMPLSLKYPSRKMWQRFKSLKAKLFGKSI